MPPYTQPTGTRGHVAEERMRKLFHGEICPYEEVDFETKNCLFEVKSCNLFNQCTNNNHLVRPGAPRCQTNQLGRFTIKTDNHIMLYLRALQLNKIPKYCFVIRVGNQMMYRVLPWESVKLSNTKDYWKVSIPQIFGYNEDERNTVRQTDIQN
jgi:hypothetical protein